MTSGETVDQLLVFFTIGANGEIALVNFIQLEGKATSCGRDTCVRRWYQSDGAAYEDCQVSPSASPAERNRLLNFKTSCLTRIGGRKNVSELLPIFDEK